MSTDTIYAPATARGRAALMVIRVSGPDSFRQLEAITGRAAPAPRRLVRRDLLDGSGAVLDEAMVVAFQDGASFTSEKSVEYQIHGGIAVGDAVMRRLSQLGARLAEPGEFARRAFENGRLGLSEAEGLADLIDAETEAQRVQAMRQMRGALEDKAAAWRARCVEARALIEAAIDFADEDLPDTLIDQARARARDLRRELEAELAAAQGAARLRAGFEVAILGRPNAGKSTLINAIARRDVAITSPQAGTTRDAIEVRCDLRGLPVSFIDTAGLRETANEIEAQGVRIARRRGDEADLRIILLGDAGETPPLEPRPGDLVVANRADLGQSASASAGRTVSALTGEGVAALLDAVAAHLAGVVAEPAAATNARQMAAIGRAARLLEASLAAPEAAVAAEELRCAGDALGALIGAIDAEQVLDEVFSRFCLGK